jgi:energy-coupling factor transport system permease protein
MIATWSYKDRNTFIQRLDPRTRILGVLLLSLATVLVWDIRLLLIPLAIALLQLRLSRLTWRELRRFWLVISFLIVLLTTLTLLTGRGGIGVITHETIFWRGQLGPFTIELSEARLVFALSQLVRLFTLAALAVVLPFTIHPAMYGVTFRRLGLPDNISFALDLAVRFVPTLSHDFALTLEAQRARGYELERAGGLIKAIRNTAPLVIPTTIGAILKSEDVIDAMNLHAFGSGRRTWLQQLRFHFRDYVILLLCIGLFAGAVYLSVTGRNGLWVPQLSWPL